VEQMSVTRNETLEIYGCFPFRRREAGSGRDSRHRKGLAAGSPAQVSRRKFDTLH